MLTEAITVLVIIPLAWSCFGLALRRKPRPAASVLGALYLIAIAISLSTGGAAFAAVLAAISVVCWQLSRLHPDGGSWRAASTDRRGRHT